MTSDQFNEWFEFHTKCFPSVRQKVSENDCWVPWKRSLASVDMETAKRASQELFNIESDVWWEKHPGRIRAIASRLRQSENKAESWTQCKDYREQRFKCYLCRDTGLVSVYQGEAYHAILEDRYQRKKHFRTVTVACHVCETGKKRSGKLKTEGRESFMLEFKPGVMFREPDPNDCPDGQSVLDWQERELFDHVVNRIQPVNYNPEFAGWEA